MGTIGRVFVDIDTQCDFLEPAGALYVPGATEIVPALSALFKFADEAGVPVFSSMDEHQDDDPEFEKYPPHCLRETPGQKKLPLTLLGRSLTIRADGMLTMPPQALVGEYQQLIFVKTTLDLFGSNPLFARTIDGLEVGEYVVFGVATDVCVKMVAADLLCRGRKVAIVRDAIRAIDEKAGREACRHLTEMGARWVDVADVIEE